ncbi:MAG: hypothetical protein H6R16_3123 [Proteobacteria bacterium]|nr:hypothetical protein [Pseudomonadota bacterium]
MKRCAVLLAVLVLSACAAVPTVPPPVNAQSSALGMYVEVAVSGLATYRADTVYFVKRCPSEALCEERLITSNFAKDGRVYLLNAEPGEYQAVAAAFESGMFGDSSIYFAYFPASLVKASATAITAGGFAYAGRYSLATSYGLCADNAEPGQLKYAQMIAPDSPKCGFWRPLVHKLSSGDFMFIAGKAYPVGQQTYHYRGTGYEMMPESTDAEAFVDQARSDLSGAGWVIAK